MILISPDPVSHAANVRYNDGTMLIFSGVPQELMVSLMVTKKEILRSLFVGMGFNFTSWIYNQQLQILEKRSFLVKMMVYSRRFLPQS